MADVLEELVNSDAVHPGFPKSLIAAIPGVSPSEIKDVIRKLARGKCKGAEEISIDLIADAGLESPQYLAKVLNRIPR